MSWGYVLHVSFEGDPAWRFFCSLMDMVPPNVEPILRSAAGLCSMEVASGNMLAASAHLYQLHGVASTDLLDFAVTCDRT